jgi:transcription-repair coupling factor (superfamily II helicase)
MRLNGILDAIESDKGFRELVGNMEAGKHPVGVYGVSESAKAFLLSAVFRKSEHGLFVFASKDMDAKNLYEDLLLYENDVYYFPSKEAVFYNIDAISGDLRWERLKVMKRLLEGGRKIVVTTIDALSQFYTPAGFFRTYTFRLRKGETADLKALGRRLSESGYQRVEMVEGRGEFAQRGGILDIFVPMGSMPYRIELFGDEIDSIRTFNPETQRSIEHVDSIEIFPAKEMIIGQETMENGARRIEAELKGIIETKSKRKEYQKESLEKLKMNVGANLEHLKEGMYFETIDSYLPFFYDEPSTLFDFIGSDTIVVDDTSNSLGKLDSTYLEFRENYEAFLERGEILPSQGKLLMEKEILISELKERPVVTLNQFQKTEKFLPPRSLVSFNEVTIYNYQGQLDMLIEDIRERKKRGYATVILAGSRSRGERLVETLRDRGLESSYKDQISKLVPSTVTVTFGNQLRGFEFPDIKLSLISDKEVFGEAKRKSAKKPKKGKGLAKIQSFTELKSGDYVVHANHGIGVFHGIRQLESGGLIRDYLDISYDKNDKLFIPVEQLDMIQKYVGSEGKEPKVSKLGGSEWAKAKAKVKTSVDEIAEDLIKLYAEREKVKGFAFSKDTEWQNQFEDEFPYTETDDQLTSVEEIKADMEKDKPMDRLLCGDVGYGKTEVAMRAAFKAVMDGKQVAFLVPTTILAEQHYGNFRRRFQGFPVKVDMISRFRSPKQQSDTLRSLKEGNVDILIGTHRLISKDIRFKDLGLLVVDEEQRFGVTHKEKLKQMKRSVDVLTLSATPIPRTLHMSMTGIRDISVIETPPEERYPIQTYVVEFNEQLVRDAILREKSRGGQVYFVHNRVEDINVLHAYLQRLIPEVTIDIGHGQMSERELENAMMNFMDGYTDVLLCTTIIETGMDIQNVNTIIVNNADKLGLSQLYQLRGRVGRTNRIAYAYLTYKKDKVLTEVAEKRLRALKDFTELGSGFKIAMRDLEIRGAGNLMGKAQHGQMSVVGYDLYVKMLDEAVRMLKGEIDEAEINTVIDIKIDAYIPTEYIEDEMHKIEVYKKIASIESREEYDEVKEELIDRFSDIPDSLYNLMDIALLKSFAKKLGVLEIKDHGTYALITFATPDKMTKAVIDRLLKAYGRRIEFRRDAPAISYKITEKQKDQMVAGLTAFMTDLLASNRT